MQTNEVPNPSYIIKEINGQKDGNKSICGLEQLVYWAHNSDNLQDVEFKELFNHVIKNYSSKGKSENYYINKMAIALAENPKSAELDEFEMLFDKGDWRVRRAIVKNKRAKERFEAKYNELIPISDEMEFLKEIGSNPEVTKYKEFKRLFNENDYIRELIARNPKATDFEEFEELLIDEYIPTRMIAVDKPGATKFKNFKKLFKDEYVKIREDLAINPKATEFDEFILLFSDDNPDVIGYAAANQYATKFEEYKILFNIADKDENLKFTIAGNIGAVRFKEFKNLMLEKGDIGIIARETFKDYVSEHGAPEWAKQSDDESIKRWIEEAMQTADAKANMI